jgi:dihydroorotase
MPYDLVFHGATVIDPSQDLNAVRDVAVQGDRIAAVAESIDEPAIERVDLRGKILTPGWVDIHTHLYAGSTTWGIQADAICLSTGVTTVVDAGSPGWANFLGFKENIVDPARTQILAFVHISGIGLTYGPLGEMEDIRYADPERTAYVVHNWSDICVGIKVRQGGMQVGDNGVEPLRRAVQAAEWAGKPIMAHIAVGVPLPEILALMRPADIVTHCYQGTGDSVVDNDGRVLPEVREARQRGIYFDVGHGGGSFSYGIAKQALADNFVSDVISTDLHAMSLDDPVESLPETASKLLNLGVPLEDVIRQTTAAPATAIGRSDQLGTLRSGTVADLAAFELQEGTFDFFDVNDRREVGSQKLQPALTVRAGKIYRPADLAAELEETRRRAAQIKALTNKDFAFLGWKPGDQQ